MGARRLYQNGDVFGVERVTMGPAISRPQVVVVELYSRQVVAGRFGGKSLAVDGAVLRRDGGGGAAGFELGREGGAIVTRNHECGHELLEELLLQGIAEAVTIGVRVKGRVAGGRLRKKERTARNRCEKDCGFQSPGGCGQWAHEPLLYTVNPERLVKGVTRIGADYEGRGGSQVLRLSACRRGVRKPGGRRDGRVWAGGAVGNGAGAGAAMFRITKGRAARLPQYKQDSAAQGTNRGVAGEN